MGHYTINGIVPLILFVQAIVPSNYKPLSRYLYRVHGARVCIGVIWRRRWDGVAPRRGFAEPFDFVK